MAGLKVLRKWQAGLEAARGTGVAATRVFHAVGQLDKKQPGHWPMHDVGSFDRRRDRYALLIESGGSIDCPVSFEDLAWWLQFAAKGSVAGAQIAATTAYRYTFTPSAAADDLKSGTFEWGDDFQVWKSTFGMVNKLTIKGAPGEPLSMVAELFTKDRVESTFTAALTARQVEVALGRRSTLTIDEPGGTIGTTTVAGRLLGFTHVIDNKLDRFYSMDDADAAGVSDITREDRIFETKLRYRFNNILEYQKWNTNTERLIKVKFVGTDAGGGNLREASFFLPGWYEDHQLGDTQGAVTVEMTLNSRYSATLGYAASYQVVNALATLP